MKKIKKFLQKCDLVTFALIALLAVSTVFAWTQLSGTGPRVEELPVAAPDVEKTAPVFNPVEIPTVATPEVFVVPVETSRFNMTTTFFNETSTDGAVLASGIFYFQVGGGKYSHPSRGVSFACGDDAAVNVIAPLSGTVRSVVDDDPLRGTMITIDHGEGLQTVLTGVYNVSVAAGSQVVQGEALGVTGLSRLEPDSGNVVHLEVLYQGEHVDPEGVIGRSINDL